MFQNVSFDELLITLEYLLTISYRDPELRPTAKELLEHEFCVVDPSFRFADTQLAKMIRVDDKEKKMKKQKQQQEQSKKQEEQLQKK